MKATLNFACFKHYFGSSRTHIWWEKENWKSNKCKVWERD